MRNHVMIDLETMGTGQTAAIVSIGGVFFDPYEDYTDTNGEFDFPEDLKLFYKNVDLQSSIDAGLSVDGDTVMWWMEQGKEAVQALTKDPAPITLREGLTELRSWVYKTQRELADQNGVDFKQIPIYSWSKGSHFDYGILNNAFKVTNIRSPWLFWNIRDMRTTVAHAFGDNGRPTFENIGVKHNAMYDALSQVIQLQESYKKIGK